MRFTKLIRKQEDIFIVTKTVDEAGKVLSLPVLTDSCEIDGCEAVFGDTSRDISKVAKAILEKKLSEKKKLYKAINDLSGYLIYSDGVSVAVVWTDFQLCEAAVACFMKNAVGSSHSEGEIFSEFLSLSAYLKDREEKIIADRWERLAGAIPTEFREDMIREFKTLYSLFDYNAAAKWLGSLYDPETGGWYATQSARAHEGFLPDLENTFYAFHSIVGILGMAEMFGDRWEKAMPEDLIMKSARWIQSLQAEDGYFYLPQWPKELIEKSGFQLRITRDVGSATTFLTRAKLEPIYKRPEAGGSSSQSPSILSQYESVESFGEYLRKLEGELEGISDFDRAWKFYLWSSYFQTTTQLLTDEMKEMTVEFFDKHQNPENGMWSNELHYHSTNGIHKIASVYNKLGRELKHADKIVNSTLKILTWDKETKPIPNTCDLYNVWSVFPYLYKNIRMTYPGTPEEKEARCEAIKKLVFRGAAEAIRNSADQLKAYARGGGTFSTFKVQKCGRPGFEMAINGTVEGDLPGFLFAAYDVPRHIFEALELSDYELPYFTEHDRLIYVDTIRSMTPPKKLPVPNS